MQPNLNDLLKQSQPESLRQQPIKFTETKAPTQGQQEEQQYIKDYITSNNSHSGTIVMKTARGKTIIIARLTHYFNTSTLILCHNIRNAHRTAEKIKELCQEGSERVACITSKSKETETKEITITTHTGFVQNFVKYQGKFSQIIYDECDYNLSFPNRRFDNSNMCSCLILSDCNIIWGLTGTPYKDIMGQRPIVTMFGTPISKPNQENNGYNILPHIVQLQYPIRANYTWTTWHELRAQMVQDENRIQAQLEAIKRHLGKYNVILFENVAEVERFYTELKQVIQIPIIKFHGQLKVRELREQQEYHAACRENKQSYLIVGTIDMIGRGEDIPELDTIFFFAPVKFKGNVVQAVGRGLRALPDKKEVVVYDWLDRPLLKKQAQEREKTYKIEYTKDVLIDKIEL